MRTCATGIVLCLIIAASIGAAPVFQRRAELPGELQSLASLHELAIVIDHTIGRVMDEYTLRKRFSAALRRSGFKVVEGTAPPRVALQYIVTTEPDMPGVIGLTTILAVHQGVTLRRLEKDLTVPVASLVHATLCREKDLDATMEREIQTATDRLADYVKQASKHRSK
ncbi:MAG: hypothetical protein CMJ18_19605 [Phycisphaeraceae bacterium]|nr:hypothetical protein [Phycisphaeraceae bacterium]